jgi:hypothetical protein
MLPRFRRGFAGGTGKSLLRDLPRRFNFFFNSIYFNALRKKVLNPGENISEEGIDSRT